MPAFLARPDDARSALFHREPAPVGVQLTCDASEVAVISASGRILATLGPGRHHLTAAAIPALRMASGGLEVLFVSTRLTGVRFGGAVGAQRDPTLDLAFEPRAFGTASFKVVDPGRLAAELQEGASPEGVTGLLKTRLLRALGEAIVGAKVGIADLAAPATAQRLGGAVQAAEPFADLGLAIDGFDMLAINVSEETLQGALKLQKQRAAKAAIAAEPTTEPMRPAVSPRPAVPAPAAPGAFACPKCGAPAAKGKFCSSCGAPLPKPAACAGCGAELKPNAKFCMACGKPVGALACSQCRVVLAPGAKFCPECGTKA